MKPYLSVIIPYCNAPEKLSRLLATIGKSKKAPLYEIVVVDDGSRQPLTGSNVPVTRELKKRTRIVS